MTVPARPVTPTSREQATVYSALTQRPDTRHLETDRLPLVPVSFDLHAAAGEIQASRRWPPARFADRQARIGLYRQLWHGDHSYFVSDRRHTRVGVNSYRRTIAVVVNGLLRVAISTAPDGALDLLGFSPQDLRHLAHDTLTDMLRYGGAVVATLVDEDGEISIRVIAPDEWVPLDDGGWVLSAQITTAEATTAAPDETVLTVADPDGYLTTRVFGGGVGGALGEERPDQQADAGRGWLTIIPTLPAHGLWGTSIFDLLVPVTLEYAIQASRYSHVLNEHGDPTYQVTVDRQALDALTLSDDSDVAALADLDDPDAWDDLADLADQYQAATQVARDLRRQDVAVVPGGEVRGQYIEYSGSLQGAQWYLDWLTEQRHLLTGIPAALEESTGFPSGVALERMLLLLIGDSRSLWWDARSGLEAALNAAYETPVVDLVWPDPFVDPSPAAAEPGMTLTLN